MVTTGLTKQDSLECNCVCCIYTLSCCSFQGYTYAITCVCTEEGLVPGSPLTFFTSLPFQIQTRQLEVYVCHLLVANCNCSFVRMQLEIILSWFNKNWANPFSQQRNTFSFVSAAAAEDIKSLFKHK